MSPTVCEITLDVCGLEPPEPLERVLNALDALAHHCRLRMVIDREPLPLYDILTRRGFQYSVDVLSHGRREIRIWRKQ